MNQANKRLEKVKNVNDLKKIIQRLDVSSPGSVTLLYSGVYGDSLEGLPAKIIAGELAKSIADGDSEVRIINNSEAAKFLNISDNSGEGNHFFLDALKEVFGDDPNKYGTKSNQFLYGEVVDGVRVPNGAWDIVSARFVENTVGPVVTITGGADLQRVFGQTELPRLLENRKITTIDGIPRTALTPLGVQSAFEAIKAQSEVKVSEIRIVVDEAGRPVIQDGTYQLDTRTFLGDLADLDGTAIDAAVPTRALADFVPGERLASHAEGLEQLRRIQDGLLETVDQGAGTKGVLKGLQALDHLGGVIDVLSLALAAKDAKEAFDQGDRARAQAILTEWGLEFAGAMVAGRLAALATAPLIAAGPLGLLLAAGLTIGASVAGGMFADDLMRMLWPSILQFHDDLLDDLKHSFGLAESMSSPLILDLDGDGIETLAVADSAVHFDHDVNGFAERTGWVSPDDALLVRDLDGNGAIESGRELFGNQTILPQGWKASDGFEALAGLDANLDGRIDAADPAWGQLRLWRDADSDGQVDAGELGLLHAAGVQELLLSYTNSLHVDEQGNQHRQLGFYRTADGNEAEMVDVWFALDSARSKFLQEVPVSEEMRALPDLPGSGTVPGLHQVLMANPGGVLEGLIRDWMAGDSAQRTALMQDLVFHWTGVQDYVNPASPNDILPRRRLAVQEKLLGTPFRDGWNNPLPGFRALEVSDQGFAHLVEELEAMLIAQVDVPPLLQAHASGGDVLAVLRDFHGETADGARLVKIGRLLDRLEAPGADLRQQIGTLATGEVGLFGLHLRAMASIEAMQFGGSGDDPLYGSEINDWLVGSAGNDLLSSQGGADLLIGGLGNDSLYGGEGGDLYAFARGDGTDSLVDHDATAGNRDAVIFTDLAASQVQPEQAGHHLLLRYGETDLVTVENHFLAEAHRIEAFHFADGTTWEAQDLVAMLSPEPVVA